MPLKVADRVKEYTTTSGIGGVSFIGAYNGFQRFDDALSTGDTTYYVIEENDKWEVGIGTYGSHNLDRNTVLASSNNGNKIVLGGSGTVSIVYPADKAVFIDDLIVVSGISSYASGQAIENQSDIVAVSGLIADNFLPAGSGALIDQNTQQIASVSGWAQAYVDYQDHSATAVSGWAQAYVDEQDHNATAVSGWADSKFTDSANDLSSVSGWTQVGIDDVVSDLASVSGWTQVGIDSVVSDLSSVSGWTQSGLDAVVADLSATSGWADASIGSLSGWTQTGLDSASSDLAGVSGWTQVGIDAVVYDLANVSGWTQVGIDSVVSDLSSVSGWTSSNFTQTNLDVDYVSGIATYSSGLAIQNESDIAAVSGLIGVADFLPGATGALIDQNTDDIATASGALRDSINTNAADIVTASGALRDSINANTADIATASGALRDSINENILDIASVSGLLTPSGDHFTFSNAVLTYFNSAGGSFDVDLSSISGDVYAMIVDGAPATLDTLNEIAAALNDDANIANTLTALITNTSGNLQAQITDNVNDLSSTSGYFETRVDDADAEVIAVSGWTGVYSDAGDSAVSGWASSNFGSLSSDLSSVSGWTQYNISQINLDIDYVSGVSYYASGQAVQNESDIAAVSGLIGTADFLPGASGSLIDLNTQLISSVSGWSETYSNNGDAALSGWAVSYADSGDAAVSGWAQSYVDSQDHSATSVSGWASVYSDAGDVSISGWASATFITSDDDSYVSGIASYASGQAIENESQISSVSGWAQSYVDSQDHSAISVSGWAEATFLTTDDDTYVSGVAAYASGQAVVNESEISSVSGWAQSYVDSQDHSAASVSGWAEATFLSVDDDTYISGVAVYASGQAVENESDISYISGIAVYASGNSGGGTADLQTVTDNGATTTNAITITNNNITASSGLFNSLDMTPLGDADYPAWQEGVIFYDAESHSLAVYNDEADITLQVGQEQYLRVRNETGATIYNGTAVMINGVHGNAAPTISGAIANSDYSSNVVGLATHDIEHQSFGYVTTYGIVRDIDTSAFSAGDEIYLSATQIGSGTNASPVIPNYKVNLGHVINSSSSNGSILVQIGQPKLGGGDMKSEAPLNLSGIPFVTQVADATAGGSQTDPLFIFDSGNRQLQLGSGLQLLDGVPSNTSNVLYNDGGELRFNGSAVGNIYTAGSGLTLTGTEFSVYGGSGNFEYVELTTDNNVVPTFKFLGSGVNDTPVTMEVRSSFQSATGSGTALLFQGTQGQLFSITDNLSSGTIFNVSDITGLPMLEVTASGDVEIGEFADNITIHQPVRISGGVPADTTDKLYNNAGELYFNGASLAYDDTYVSGIATYASGQAIQNESDILSASGYFENEILELIGVSGIEISSVGSTVYLDNSYVSGVATYASGQAIENETQISSVSGWAGSALSTKLENVVEDTTPQLGGTLDANGNTIDMGTNTITDTKVGQWDTAYGWGDHSTQGYLTADDDTYVSGVAVYASGQAVQNEIDIVYVSGVAASAGGGGGTVQGTDGTYDIQPTNEGATAGNTRGESSVDLQTDRSAAAQVASGGCSTISGGSSNTASGACSTVGGGRCNTASGSQSTISGGYGNTASGGISTIGGGGYNTASCTSSVIGAGLFNIASCINSTVGGGQNNTASGYSSTIAGGKMNSASACSSTVSGGYRNTAAATNSVVTGGGFNYTNARHSVVSGHSNVIVSPTNECCSRGATISGGIGHNSSGGTINATTGDITGTITCCNAGAFSTIGGGCRNIATGANSTVAGGKSNTVSGGYSTVGGGWGNVAAGTYSTVGGGGFNYACGSHSAVGGGNGNTSCGCSTIGGGLSNTASGYFSFVGGGQTNTASSTWSTVSGGKNNTASSYLSTVGGGYGNTAAGTNSAVTGGCSNYTNARHSVVGGHSNVIVSPTNECCSRGATVSGGLGHNSSGGTIDATTGDITGTITCCNAGCFSTIGGGCRNIATGANSTVSGGTGNTASGNYSTVSGGYGNTASGACSTVGGGYSNEATCIYSVIVGGYNQNSTHCHSFVGGGYGNTASGSSSAVAGGVYNTSSGPSSNIGGGCANTNSAYFGTIAGGRSNCVAYTNGTVGGGHNNLACNAATVSGGGCNCACGYASTVSGGYGNTAAATNSTVAGGNGNYTNARYSIVSGHSNVIVSPTNECCSRGATISGGIGHNSSGGTIDATTGDITGTITCCNAGAFSTIGGGCRNIAIGCNSTVGGGKSNTASGGGSIISGGHTNTASGNYSTVGGGWNNAASNTYSTVSGGNSHTASGGRSTIGGGGYNTASGSASTVIGGVSNTASGNYSTASGLYGKATRYGETSHAAGRFAADGDAQHTILVARKSTTDATANQVMFLNNLSARLTIPAETTWMFTIKLAAHNDTNNDGGWWYFRGGIARDGAGNTSLIGSVTSEYSVDSNISTATAEVVADDTNDALEIRVTGVASKSIRWVAVADISQVSWGTP